MSLFRIPNYNGLSLADDANTAGAIVVRAADGAINVSALNATAVVNSGPTFGGYKNYTTTATLDGTQTNITVDGASGAFVLTLPPAAACSGQIFFIARKATANSVTIKGNGSELILYAGGSANTFVLQEQGQAVCLFCDGTQWYVLTPFGTLETLIADPGSSGAIPVSSTGHVEIVTAGSETRTLAAPSYLGQQLLISMQTHGGDCVITVSTTYDQSSHTTITLNTAGDAVLLVGKKNGSNLRWSLVMNDGAALA